MSVHKHEDPFRRHRLALRAILPDAKGSALNEILEEIGGPDASSFAEFLVDQGLGPSWHQLVRTRAIVSEMEPGFLAVLERERLATAALYLAQTLVLRDVDALFSVENIAYAAIKGTDVRERVYADPTLRPACDIDILINPDQREAAARVLIGAGFTLRADADNISHQATFTRGPVDIDLHWDILRPGRTRISIVYTLLARRQRVVDFWVLDDSDVVFLMLVHPAFNKYVCSPRMGLNRVLDFILWTHERRVNWDAVAEKLQQTGLKTAAWTVLQWFALLLKPENLPVPAEFIARISPGRLRSRYLTYWLRYELPTRWFDQPLRIQLGFTLFLHDRLGDARHAVSGWLRSRRTRAGDPLLRMPMNRDDASPQ